MGVVPGVPGATGVAVADGIGDGIGTGPVPCSSQQAVLNGAVVVAQTYRQGPQKEREPRGLQQRERGRQKACQKAWQRGQPKERPRGRQRAQRRQGEWQEEPGSDRRKSG